MARIVLALALSLGATGVALACEGNPNCSSEHCKMPSTQTAQALPEGTKVTLAVNGMKCGSCADKIKTALMGVEGVKGANVDATTGKAEISYDAKKTSTDKLVAAVAGTGHFTATVATN
ncbi:MAG: heavy-metal-associated domain-containing protein [Myxococcota bacterium]